MILAEVIEINKETQYKAREVNIRAGKTVFPIMSQEEWKSWLKNRLNSARCAKEVLHPERLLLPELDENKIREVYRENPESIFIPEVGVFRVYYDSKPQIQFSRELFSQNKWTELPDEGIKLPSGREVEVSIPCGWHTFTDSSIPILKEKVKNYLNQRAWESWQKPELPVKVSEAAFPEIEIRQYGKCAVTGDPLYAYGTVQSYQYYDGLTWTGVWYKEKSQAELTRAKSIDALAGFNSKERKKQALSALTIPDPALQNAQIPEIVGIEGGYGVVAVNPDRWYDSHSHFIAKWVSDLVEAQVLRERAMEYLGEVKAKEIQKRMLMDAQAEAITARGKVLFLYRECENGEVELRRKLHSFCFADIPPDLPSVLVWTQKAKEVISEAETAKGKIEKIIVKQGINALAEKFNKR